LKLNTKSAGPTEIYTLRNLAYYFLKLGSIGFGGPVALVGYMHRDLVEKKRWIGEDDYRQGLALSQLAPGPLAAQLAIYIGYVHHRILGATIAGVAFVLPSFLMVAGIGWAYMEYEGLSWMQAVFTGVGPAVIGIIAVSSFRLTKKSVGKDLLLWFIFWLVGISTFISEREILWLVLGAGIITWFIKAPPGRNSKIAAGLFAPAILLAASGPAAGSKLVAIAWFFTKAGAFVFGSGLAIVPFLYGGVVKEYEWLNEQQFLDAVAVAMITPGPIVITVGFIGYIVAGFPGACVAAAATFIPCYLFTILPAPYFKKYGKNPGLKAFVDGVTAAAVGAIAGSVCVLAKRQFSDPATGSIEWISIAIGLTVAIVLFRFRKIPEPYVIGLAAIAGIAMKVWLD